MQLSELAQMAIPILRDAGELVRSMHHPEVSVKEGHANFVTEADLASQKFLMEHLAPLLPEAHFFAEEQEHNILLPGDNWIIDPIDGTTNFMRGYRPSAISVGLVRNGKGVLGLVYDPFADELFSAAAGQGAFCGDRPIHAADVPPENALIVFGTSPYYRERADETFAVIRRLFLSCGDIRRSGSAALDLCYVAAGRCDGFYESILSPWDFAAASVILEEAGARIGTVEGRTFGYGEKLPILAGSPRVYGTVQAAAEGR